MEKNMSCSNPFILALAFMKSRKKIAKINKRSLCDKTTIRTSIKILRHCSRYHNVLKISGKFAEWE